MDKNGDIKELQKYIELCNSFLGKFVEGGSMCGLFLRSEDEAQFKRFIIEVNEFLKELLGENNIYSVNIFNAINAPTMGGGPSYSAVQDVIGLLQAAATKLERKKQRIEHISIKAEGSITQESWYDTAQICINGHNINDSVQEKPQFNKKFCDNCGSQTITECQNCKTGIQGRYHEKGALDSQIIIVPAFCQHCGHSFPWTASKIEAAKELALEEESISSSEKEIIVKSIDDLIAETPRTKLAANRFKKIFTKMGTSAAGILKEILVDVASETAKKIIWPEGK
jgi:hypothetical protein